MFKQFCYYNYSNPKLKSLLIPNDTKLNRYNQILLYLLSKNQFNIEEINFWLNKDVNDLNRAIICVIYNPHLKIKQKKILINMFINHKNPATNFQKIIDFAIKNEIEELFDYCLKYTDCLSFYLEVALNYNCSLHFIKFMLNKNIEFNTFDILYNFNFSNKELLNFMRNNYSNNSNQYQLYNACIDKDKEKINKLLKYNNGFIMQQFLVNMSYDYLEFFYILIKNHIEKTKISTNKIDLIQFRLNYIMLNNILSNKEKINIINFLINKYPNTFKYSDILKLVLYYRNEELVNYFINKVEITIDLFGSIINYNNKELINRYLYLINSNLGKEKIRDILIFAKDNNNLELIKYIINLNLIDKSNSIVTSYYINKNKIDYTDLWEYKEIKMLEYFNSIKNINNENIISNFVDNEDIYLSEYLNKSINNNNYTLNNYIRNICLYSGNLVHLDYIFKLDKDNIININMAILFTEASRFNRIREYLIEKLN